MRMARYDSTAAPGSRLECRWEGAEVDQLVRRYFWKQTQLRFVAGFNGARTEMHLMRAEHPAGNVASYLRDSTLSVPKLVLSIYEKAYPILAEIAPPWGMVDVKFEYDESYLRVILPTLGQRRPPRLGRAKRVALRRRTEPSLL